MNFSQFNEAFLTYLNNNDKNCLKLIEKNKKFVESLFNKNSNPANVKDFVKEINYFILQTRSGYKLIESALKMEPMKYVNYVFRNSKILIEACKMGNEVATKWLIYNMKINPYVQDKVGRTALMYAVSNENLLFVVKKYRKDYKCLMMKDYKGNNALYYAIYNTQAIALLTEVDYRHTNNNHETALMFYYRKGEFNAIKALMNNKGVNVNIPDKDGKTILMHLAENLRVKELEYFNSPLLDLRLTFI